MYPAIRPSGMPCRLKVISIISAYEMAQGVIVPVKLVGGRKLMGRKPTCNAVCAEGAVFLEELCLRLTLSHVCVLSRNCCRVCLFQ